MPPSADAAAIAIRDEIDMTTTPLDMLTADTLRKATACSPATAARVIEPLRVAAARFNIDTPARLAHWLAQLAHESARFERVVENLNYSAAGLAATWPSRFRANQGGPNVDAVMLHRKPEEIANSVYASRMGNGPPESGDGWRYRGRGYIQITGKNNYLACGAALGLDLLRHPETLESPLYAALSAGWYWNSRGLNQHADAGDVERITLSINGGLTGIEDRRKLTKAAMRAMK